MNKNQEGQGLLEYMILLALVVIASVTMVRAIGDGLVARLKGASSVISSIPIPGH